MQLDEETHWRELQQSQPPVAMEWELLSLEELNTCYSAPTEQRNRFQVITCYSKCNAPAKNRLLLQALDFGQRGDFQPKIESASAAALSRAAAVVL